METWRGWLKTVFACVSLAKYPSFASASVHLPLCQRWNARRRKSSNWSNLFTLFEFLYRPTEEQRIVKRFNYRQTTRIHRKFLEDPEIQGFRSCQLLLRFLTWSSKSAIASARFCETNIHPNKYNSSEIGLFCSFPMLWFYFEPEDRCLRCFQVSYLICNS